MKKLLSTAVVFGVMASMTPVAFADVAATALPTLDSAINGSVTANGNNMNVKIDAGQGGVGTFNWKDFNIGKDSSVNYEFSAHNQTALNKVSASGGISQIYGKITSSGCQNCGYEGTGKVILINPNGVLFGDGANVNLNSFTVTNMKGTFDEANNKLILTKDANATDYGIVVGEGATIHGDKAVNFAANNVAVYNGSKISTNVAPNYGTDSYGKVKIVTADGVNFAYYNNGAVSGLDGFTASADKMMINLNGDIKSGNIDVRNYSENTDSEINLNGATLKATKAVSGNDGNIWLTATNKVIVDNSKLETVNYSNEAASRAGGNVKILAGKKVSVANSDIDTVGNVSLTSKNYDVALDNTTVDTAKDVTIEAGNIASIQNGSSVNANNVTVKGGERAQVVNSKVNAKNNIDVTGKSVWFKNADLTAGKEINATATDDYLYAENTKMKADKITLTAKTDLTGDIDVTNSKTYIKAGNDVDVNLANVGNRQKGLVAQGGHDVTITTDGTLSVSSLISGNDMTINADKVIAGLDYTTVKHLDNETGVNRSYIEVGGKNFNSNTKNDSYEVTASGELTADGKYNQKHHIQYGQNGEEKILLVHKRPYVAPVEPVDPIVPVEPEEPDDDITINDDQASMLNKLPRQPESISHSNAITDGRTMLVDVFAAASQIEIEDDEE